MSHQLCYRLDYLKAFMHRSLTLSTLAKEVEGCSMQDELTAKSNKANYPIRIRGVDFDYALPSCLVLSPIVDMHGK